MIRKCGVGAELAKCDIKSMFRILPVHPLDFNLLGFQFGGEFYIDRALLMGYSVSCAAFGKFSTFIESKLDAGYNAIPQLITLMIFSFVEK